MLEEADDRFTTANEILRYFKAVYHDLNKLQNAKYEFKRLIIKKSDLFHSFLTKFAYLAEEAKIPKSKYKFKFNNKLFFKLRRVVINNFILDSNYAKFLKYYS